MHLDENELTVVKFIFDYRKQHSYSPSQREIAQGTYRSLGTTNRVITGLVKKGFLVSAPIKNRNIIPSSRATEFLEVSR